MPIELVTVDRVDPVQTRKPGCTQYLVVAHTVALPSLLVRYQTLNPWAASLCERAKETEQLLQVTWRDHRFGRELVHVDFVQ